MVAWNRHREAEALSAHVDGEAQDPSSVEARIAADPKSAKTAAAYRALAEQLRTLPSPEPDAAFADRVRRRVAASASDGNRNVRGLRWAHAATLLSVVGIAGFAGLFLGRVTAPPTEVANFKPALVDTSLLDRLSAALENERELDSVAFDAFDTGLDWTPVYVDDPPPAPEGEAPILTQGPFALESDWYYDVHNMGRGERTVLRALLAAYLEELGRRA